MKCCVTGCNDPCTAGLNVCYGHRGPVGSDLPVIRPPDDVNAPAHYRSGGLEAIDVIEAFDVNFRLGNAVKYILRAGRKDPAKRKQDLEKAAWYLAREIAKS